MASQMQNKVCVITGGAGSIGAASAKLLRDEGAKVMLIDLHQAALQKTASDIGGEVAWCAADVTKSDQVENAIAATVERFGKIDVLFSNAGNFGTVAAIADYPEDVFDSVLAVHVRGAFLCAKHAVPQMNDGGSIIITSSVAGVTGDPGVYGYITAKHAPRRTDARTGQGVGRTQYPGEYRSSGSGRQFISAWRRTKIGRSDRP